MISTKQSIGAASRESRAQEMRRLVREQERSGLSQRAFCEIRGVPLSTLSWWRKKLGIGCGRKPEHSDGGANAGFLEVQVVDDASIPKPASTAVPAAIEICLPAGAVIRIPSEAPEATLRRVLDAVGAQC